MLHFQTAPFSWRPPLQLCARLAGLAARAEAILLAALAAAVFAPGLHSHQNLQSINAVLRCVKQTCSVSAHSSVSSAVFCMLLHILCLFQIAAISLVAAVAAERAPSGSNRARFAILLAAAVGASTCYGSLSLGDIPNYRSHRCEM